MMLNFDLRSTSGTKTLPPLSANASIDLLLNSPSSNVSIIFQLNL